MKKSIIFFLLFSAIACTQKQEDLTIEHITLSSISEIDQFSDSTFFSDIRFMCTEGDLLYVSDYTRSQVIVLKDGIVQQTISSKGQAPHELLGASAVAVRNDTVFIHDATKREILLFRNGQYIRSVKALHGMYGATNFGLSGDNLIVPEPQDSTSLVLVNIHTDDRTRFGKMFEFNSPIKNRNRNHRFVCVQDTLIYAVSDNQPVIEQYDRKGNFINSYNYSNVEEVGKRLLYAQQQPDKENSVYGLVANSYLQDNKLYLLLVTMDDNNQSESNKVLEINLDKTMRASRLLNLGEGGFMSLCLGSNHLWAFNRTACTLVKYEMP